MEMTIDEVRAFQAEVVIFAVGSTEPHGPSMPYGTDAWQAGAAVRKGVLLANSRGARALMYPTLPVGNNVNFRAWPFACRIRVQTLMQVLLDIMEALTEDGIRKIVLFNGHGGNTDAIRATLRAFHHTQPVNGGAFACMTSSSSDCGKFVDASSPHGGESEASRMLHLKPDFTHPEQFQDQPFGKVVCDALERPEVYFVRPWHRYLPFSGGGDTRQATAEKGGNMLDTTAEWLSELLVQLTEAEFTDAFPYPPGE